MNHHPSYWLSPLSFFAPVQNYKLLIEAYQAAAKVQYDLAINKLQSTKTCQPEKSAAVNLNLAAVFREINGERLEAERQKQRAIEN